MHIHLWVLMYYFGRSKDFDPRVSSEPPRTFTRKSTHTGQSRRILTIEEAKIPKGKTRYPVSTSTTEPWTFRVGIGSGIDTNTL